MPDRELGEKLIALARNAIGARFGMSAAQVPRDPALDQHAATFVTLMQAGELRGCVGSLEARRRNRLPLLVLGPDADGDPGQRDESRDGPCATHGVHPFGNQAISHDG